MSLDLDRYVTEETGHGAARGSCDLCHLDPERLRRVVSGASLCPDCIERVGSRAESLVSDPDSPVESAREGFTTALEETVGARVILSFPEQDSPRGTHSYALTGVRHVGHEQYDEYNEVHIEYVLDTDPETYRAAGLTISTVSN